MSAHTVPEARIERARVRALVALRELAEAGAESPLAVLRDDAAERVIDALAAADRWARAGRREASRHAPPRIRRWEDPGRRETK